tara:strand:+ start:1275 stop:1454 length:180 start_codon:yes stop_codon:yes gene_type:complete
MTNKKTEELNEAELDEVTGGNFEIQRTNKGIEYQDGTDLLKRKAGDKGFASSGSANPTV